MFVDGFDRASSGDRSTLRGAAARTALAALGCLLALQLAAGPAMGEETPEVGGDELPGIMSSSLLIGDLLIRQIDKFKLPPELRKGSAPTVSSAAIYLGKRRVVEATVDGIVEHGLEAFVKQSERVVAIREMSLRRSHRDKLIEYSRAHLGEKPTKWAVVKGARYKQFTWTTPNVRPVYSRKGGDAFFMSDFVFDAFKYAGHDFAESWPEPATPGALPEIDLGDNIIYVGHMYKEDPIDRDRP